MINNNTYCESKGYDYIDWNKRLNNIHKASYKDLAHSEQYRIIKEGDYESGNFPPCFKSELDAVDYLEKMEWKHSKKVVPLRLF